MNWNFMNGFVKIVQSKSSKKVVIWGAAQAGRQVFTFLQSIGIDIDCFVDSVYTKADGELMGKKITSPNILKNEKKGEVFILIASKYYAEIRDSLIKWEYAEMEDFIGALEQRNHILNTVGYDTEARELLRHEKKALFKTIEIETVNRCNNDCAFCPVNVHGDRRKFEKMSEELYDSILDQLKEIGYSGIISIFSNNEPFIDERIVDFLKKVKDKLPECDSYLFTNGILLSMDKFLDAIQWLDYLIIDNYSDDYEFLPTVKEIYQYCKDNEEIGSKVKIIKRKKNEVLSSRGGQAPNKNPVCMKGITCLLPFHQMVVRPGGKVSLCCNDALGECTLGDLKHEKILDIWYGEKYEQIREKILTGREMLPLCKGCDSANGQMLKKYRPYGERLELLSVWE